MLPALALQRLGAVLRDQRDGRAARARAKDAADAGDGDAGDSSGHADGGRGGEEEFVIVSAVQGVVEGCAGMDGQKRGVDFRGYAGLFAEAGEVGGEAVAEVHGCRSQALAAQAESLGDARLRPEMPRQKRLQLHWDASRIQAVGAGLALFSQLVKMRK